MTTEEVKEAIKEIPVGSKIQLIKKNGDIVEVQLAHDAVEGTERKDYGNIVVPALPPALIVRNTSRMGQFRIDIEDLVKIAWIE